MRAAILGAAVLGLAAPLSAQMMDPITSMLRADKDGDGVITKAEYLAARGAHFAAMDRDGDGALSAKDGAGDERGGRRMERMVAQADADGDGKVTRAEFDRAPTPLFDRMDANNDGTVDKSEVAKARAAFEARRDERGN